MFFAAPMPTGTDNAMPMTVEITVIHRLSTMPSAISLQRLVKSGGKNAAKNRAPRGRPSHTRAQFTSVVPSASARKSAKPKPSDQRSHALLISGGFFHWRGAAASVLIAASRQSGQTVAVQQARFQRDD